MNLLDKAIAKVSPVAGLHRAQARLKLSVVMNYDAASRGRRTKHWKAPATDADAASSGGRARIRQLSRDMVRNAWVANRAQMVIRNNVVGSGIVPSVTAPTDEDAEQIRKVIKEHLLSKKIDAYGEQNLYGLQKVVINTTFESGEILARRRPRGPQSGLALPFQIQLLEPDYLDTTRQTNGKNEIIDGVEYDAFGRVVAYWIYRIHPGAATRKMDFKSDRVPAQDIIHVRKIDRPGQMRGVGWLAPVMLPLGELRDYQEAQIVKQKISALLAGVLETDDSDFTPEADAPGLDDLAPGAIVQARGGQKVSWTDPPRVDDYDPVMKRGLASVAAGIGITYESLTGDLNGVNFSSGKMGRIEMDQNVEDWQTDLMIEQFCRGVETWMRDGLRLTSQRKIKFEMTWTAPVRPQVDPLKETKPMIEKVKAGITSLQRVQRQLGLDPEVIAKERAEDIAAGNMPVALLPAPPDPAEVKPEETKKGEAKNGS